MELERSGPVVSRPALAYGVFSGPDGGRRIGVRHGPDVVDVGALATADGAPGAQALRSPSLDRLLAAGRPVWERVGDWLRERLAGEVEHRHRHRLGEVRLHLPFTVADYVDFYSSRSHAQNVGRLLRPGTEPLPAAWEHLPMGYHGRAGSVVVSGTPVRRPCGLRVEQPGGPPRLGPSLRLDFEAEVGFVVGVPSAGGESVPVEAFAEHVFGVVLVNDWSARDVQAFEYVPLGPFLGKSFATSVSAWVVPLEELESARVPGPARTRPDAAYLREREPWGLDLSLTVEVAGTVVARPPFAGTWWTGAQQLAHLTVNGAGLRTGDLYASGTVSGPEPGQWGSLLELSRDGTRPVRLDDGSTRSFLLDGDEVVLRADAPAVGGGRVALGEVRGTVVPARKLSPPPRTG